jgi:uncharacterized protein (DUF2235 family)
VRQASVVRWQKGQGMKRIAICFDGTSNRHDAEYPTNVVAMARCIALRGHGDVTQLVQYHPGLGSGRGTNRIAKAMDRALGGALAFGLIDVIEEAYRGLVFAWEPGDEIYLFGFSRGAFTARVFAGLLRSCGIGARRNLQMIPEAIARHLSKAPETHPDHPSSVAFRARFAPETVTGWTDADAARVKAGALRLTIRHMGLWDSVKSFSVWDVAQGGEAARARGRFFHDNRLSSMVESARHAMALDERRSLYPPLPWSNLDDLNLRSGRGDAPFRQVWFPGDHGSVGGGGNRQGLSAVAFRWVALGAARADLRLIGAEVRRQCWHMDPVGERLENRLTGGPLYVLQGHRRGPETLEDLSAAAFDRWAGDAAYRGRPLRRVRSALGEMDEGARADLRARLVARDGVTHVPGSPWWVGGEDESFGGSGGPGGPAG